MHNSLSPVDSRRQVFPMNQMSREDVHERLGNIDQIRDIIIGAQLREYENRFSKVESDISLLQQEMRSHIEQLKTNFAVELKMAVEALEKKLKSLSQATQEEAVDLRACVDRLNKKFSSGIQSLDETLDIQTTSIKDEISQNKAQFQEDVMVLRDMVLEELERRFTQLRQTKISKDDMAETLFALGMRLKETEFIPKLNEAVDKSSNYNRVSFLETRSRSDMLAHTNGAAEAHT